jgi:hypothetical protein
MQTAIAGADLGYRGEGVPGHAQGPQGKLVRYIQQTITRLFSPALPAMRITQGPSQH